MTNYKDYPKFGSKEFEQAGREANLALVRGRMELLESEHRSVQEALKAVYESTLRASPRMAQQKATV